MMKNTRMSRVNHPTPRVPNKQVDISGLRGADYREVPGGEVTGIAPPKHWPNKVYPLTPEPRAAEETGRGEDGSGRQSHRRR